MLRLYDCQSKTVWQADMRSQSVFRSYSYVVHLVNGRRQHMALQGIRSISAGIVQDPAINSGRPIIEGTRVFVDRIIGHLESGMSIVEICHEYDLTPDQVKVVKQLSPEQVQYVKGYADLDISNCVYRLDPDGLEEEL